MIFLAGTPQKSRPLYTGQDILNRKIYALGMKLASEFGEIDGRFQPINDMLNMCREKARASHDPDYLALVRAVQALSNEVRDLERNLLMAEDHRFGALV